MRAVGALGLAGLLLILALAVSRPLPWHWAEALPIAAGAPADAAVLVRAPGDTLQLYYQLWLVADGLLGPTPLFRDPYQFRIDGARWNLPQTFLPLAVPFTALGALVDPRAAYNLLVLLSFPLTGLAAYALVRHYTGHGLAAATAGVAYALVPARLGPLFGGQPAGFGAALVPVVLWGLDLALTRASVTGGVIGGAALAALAMLEPHYTYVTAGLVLGYLPLRWLTLAAPRRRPAGPLAAFLVLAAAAAGWLLLLRQAFLVGSIAETGRTLGEVRLFSAGPEAWLVPATYGGLLLLALAVIGLVEPGAGRRTLALGYGVVLAAGLLLSVGPTVPGVPVYQALHRWLPLFALIRNPEKFRLMTSLGAAVLAGFGVRTLLAALPPRARTPAGLAALVAVAVATAPWQPIAVSRLPDSPLYQAVAAEARRVLYLPLSRGDAAWGALTLYHATRTRVPAINGYSPLVPRRYVDEVFLPLHGLNVGDVGPETQARLRRLGVTHVVLDRGVFVPGVSPFPSSFTRDRLRESGALALQRAVDPLWLFRVTDASPARQPHATSPVGIFYEAEALPHQTGAVASDPSASGGRLVVARAGVSPAGFLVFGPYRLLPAGAYRAVFRLRGHGLTAEVTTDEGRRVLAARPVEPRAAWDDVELAFQLDRPALIEYRLRWSGVDEAAADWVAASFADRPQPEWTFEVEELPHLLGEQPDRAASSGWAGYADPAESRRIPLVSGPARLYPAGRYRVLLRARAATPVGGPVLRLTVTEPAGRTLAARAVAGSELRPGAYHEVGLDFALAQPSVLEFPVVYLGGTGIFFDRLDVRPRP